MHQSFQYLNDWSVRPVVGDAVFATQAMQIATQNTTISSQGAQIVTLTAQVTDAQGLLTREIKEKNRFHREERHNNERATVYFWIMIGMVVICFVLIGFWYYNNRKLHRELRRDNFVLGENGI